MKQFSIAVTLTDKYDPTSLLNASDIEQGLELTAGYFMSEVDSMQLDDTLAVYDAPCVVINIMRHE